MRVQAQNRPWKKKKARFSAGLSSLRWRSGRGAHAGIKNPFKHLLDHKAATPCNTKLQHPQP
jgi:hypothetical protein